MIDEENLAQCYTPGCRGEVMGVVPLTHDLLLPLCGKCVEALKTQITDAVVKKLGVKETQ